MSDILRRRDADDRDDMDRAPPPSDGCCDCFIGSTTQISTYPATAQAYYAVLPSVAGGAETEGTAVTLTSGSVPILAANVGGSVPPQGTAVIVHRTGNRSVFRFG